MKPGEGGSPIDGAMKSADALKIAQVTMPLLKRWCRAGKFVAWKVVGRWWIEPASFRRWLDEFNAGPGRRRSTSSRVTANRRWELCRQTESAR